MLGLFIVTHGTGFAAQTHRVIEMKNGRTLR